MKITRKMLNCTIDQINARLASDGAYYRLSIEVTTQLGDNRAWYEISHYDATCSIGLGSPRPLLGFGGDTLTIRECYYTLRGIVEMMHLHWEITADLERTQNRD